MTGLIVADAGPLIGLARAELPSVLEGLYPTVLVPPAVAEELRLGATLRGAAALNEAVAAGWLRVERAPPTEDTIKLEKMLGAGEAQAIALAITLGSRLLTDERLGRTVAAQRGVVVVGTGAVLLAAKAAGLVSAVAPALDELDRQGYRLSRELRARLLQLANEE